MVLGLTTIKQKSADASDAINAGVSFDNELDSAETLTGTPTITISPDTATLSNKQVNAAAVEIDGKTVAIGKAVLVTVTGGSDGVTYTITIQVSTSDSQTLVRQVLFIAE